MTQEELEKNLVLLVNTYYNIQEGADMILKLIAKILKIQGRELQHKKRQKHNDLMAKITAIRNITDSLSEDYGEAFKTGYAKKTDRVRLDGAFLVRLMLKVCDRCGDDETGQKERYVEEFVENMPPKGHLSKEIEQLFYIK